MIKKLSLIVLVSLALSCKSTKAVVAGEADVSLSTKKIIQNHYQNQLDFETLSGKLKIDYDDGDKSQSVSVSLRVRKDETIWISAPLGFVKAIITPDKVSFYNRLQNEYFEGDFSYLSNLLGTELDFYKVQNLLLGNAVLDLRKDKYSSNIKDGNYGIEPKKANALFSILFAIEPKNFKIATQEIAQTFENRFLKMDYNYQDVNTKILPNTISIKALNKEDKTTIELEYKGMEFGKELRFPYKIPKGFKEIVLE